MSNKIFVYGTLLDKNYNEPARVFHEITREIGPAQIQGKLYKISWYPGVQLSDDPADQVQGALFELSDPVNNLTFLDQYEGSEYNRSIETVQTSSGPQEAWVYLYKEDVEDAQLIPSGKFSTAI